MLLQFCFATLRTTYIVTLGTDVVLSDTNCFDKDDLDSNNIHPKSDNICGPQCRDMYVSLSDTAIGCTACDAAAGSAAHVLSCP